MAEADTVSRWASIDRSRALFSRHSSSAAALLYAGYGVAFMLFGRANNFYRGLMIAPAFLVGIAFVPRAIPNLASPARTGED